MSRKHENAGAWFLCTNGRSHYFPWTHGSAACGSMCSDRTVGAPLTGDDLRESWSCSTCRTRYAKAWENAEQGAASMKQPCATRAEIMTYLDTHNIDVSTAPEALPFAVRCMAAALQGIEAEGRLNTLCTGLNACCDAIDHDPDATQSSLETNDVRALVDVAQKPE